MNWVTKIYLSVCIFLVSRSRATTIPTKRLRDQRRLRSACAFAKSDQSLRCPHEEDVGPGLSIQRTTKTLIRLQGLICVFAGRTCHLCRLAVHWLKCINHDADIASMHDDSSITTVWKLMHAKTLRTLGKISADDILKYFFLSCLSIYFFFGKQVLTFHANGDNLHELINPVFWEK